MNDYGGYTWEQLQVAAAELRLAGIDARVIRYYLNCGDWSVITMLRDLNSGDHTVDWYNKNHLVYLQNNGKIRE